MTFPFLSRQNSVPVATQPNCDIATTSLVEASGSARVSVALVTSTAVSDLASRPEPVPVR